MALFFIDACDDECGFSFPYSPGTTIQGRNGKGLRNGQSFTVPAANQFEWNTVGMATRHGSLSAARDIFRASSATSLTVRVNTDGSITVLRSGSTTISGPSATGVVVPGSWYYVEWQVRVHDTLGVSIVRINGTEVLNTTSIDTKSGTSGFIDFLGFGATAGPSDIDDVYFMSGSSADTFMGDITVEALYPNASGDESGFTGSDGDSTNNYLNVDETPIGLPGDYNKATTSGLRDLYHLDNLRVQSATIRAVQSTAFIQKSDSAAKSFKHVIKGSTANTSSSVAATISQVEYRNIWETNPETAGAFTVSEINSLQLGVEVA